MFHFSQDSLSPKTARRLAEALKSAVGSSPGEEPSVRWATDMRPEPALDAQCCRVLAEGGALGVALGVESAAPRVLKLIHKGLEVRDAALAVKNLAAAGIAVEAMCFTDFPTETGREALMTVRFIEELRESVALFICGEFALTAGARVAQHPGEYGIRETWHAAGDEFSTALFYEKLPPRRPRRTGKRSTPPSTGLRVPGGCTGIPGPVRSPRRTPCSGTTGTGWMCSGALRGEAETRSTPPGKRRLSPQRDLEQVWQRAREQEAEIWRIMVTEKRTVTREAYRRLADALSSREDNPLNGDSVCQSPALLSWVVH